MFSRRHANDQSGCFLFFLCLHYDTQPLISVLQICAFSDMGWTVQCETAETSHRCFWLRVSQKWSGIIALNNINKAMFKSFAGYSYTKVFFTLFVSILKERPVTCSFPSNDTSQNITAVLFLHCHKPQDFVCLGINFLPHSEELSEGKCDIFDSRLNGLTYFYNTTNSNATQVPIYWTWQNCKLTETHFINPICNINLWAPEFYI
jgi:hypothetical protein